MVLPGHLAGGYLAARALLSLTHASFPPGQTTALLAIGTLAGELPDIDLVRFALDKRDADHRDYFTHAPLFWLAIALVIALVGYAAGSPFSEFVGWLVLSGSWCHLLFDSVEYGVMWLWPFSVKRFALERRVPEEHIDAPAGSLRHHVAFMFGPYLKTWTFWAEIAVTLFALYLLLFVHQIG